MKKRAIFNHDFIVKSLLKERKDYKKTYNMLDEYMKAVADLEYKVHSIAGLDRDIFLSEPKKDDTPIIEEDFEIPTGL